MNLLDILRVRSYSLPEEFGYPDINFHGIV